MKTLPLSLFIVLVLLAPRTAHAWEEMKGDHFILYYQGTDRSFADRVLEKAESYYDGIARALGYSRRSEFWLWDHRCKIYLYETKDAFHSETRQAAWSSGFAIPSKREIVSYQSSEKFLDCVLPHEMAHLIFRDFTGARNGMIPLWLDEGLALAQEEARQERENEFDQWVQKMMSEKKWIPIKVLSQIRSLKGFAAGEAVLFYAEAQSVVRFLLSSGETFQFAGFCRDLRDGTSLEAALRKNYPKVFPTLEVFDQKWIAAQMNRDELHLLSPGGGED
ncbi:MAG: hypothetical protein A3G87_04325 [Omnitrophica bacterium RIFCSPLOWO2_12_FULL_50_11]|nr:MAG: hypothetical protein A3G87_04325 [Omnitrophica bacterium RIFCSPLOWO2_12_FULL_50_11]